MAKNYMADVAKMLGVEFEEEFKIDGIELKYRFTENGVYCHVDNGWWQCSNVMLPKILLGEFEIIKLPWQPKKGDEYYYPGEGFNNICRALWGNTVFGFAYKEAGLIFKTYEECEAALPELRKKYLGGDDNV